MMRSPADRPDLTAMNDGIEDSEDGNISAFKFNWVKHLEKTMFSAYEKNKQN